MAIPWLACMLSMSAFYGLPPRVLPAMVVVEPVAVPQPDGSTRPGATGMPGLRQR
jgi:hypothetical protein